MLSTLHEHRLLRARGDETLTGSKYVWLCGEEDVRMWRCRHRPEAEEQCCWRSGWASRARLAPGFEVARMITRHLPNVLTYFRRRTTSAMTEGIARKIQALEKGANGFRNRDHFKTPIHLHGGALALYPDPTP